MTVLPQRRRFALVTTTGRFDIAVALATPLGDALRSGGMPVDDGRHLVLDADGRRISSDTVAADLVDGGLYSIVDTWGAVDPSAREEEGAQQTDHRSARQWALAPIVALAFTAGALLIPIEATDGMPLRSFAGLLAIAVAAAIVAALSRTPETRAASTTIVIVTAIAATIVGTTILLQWPVAAILLVGLAPLALRALPSLLVRVPDGAFIDYGRFLRDRWTVRGPVPESSPSVGFDEVRRIVDTSGVRLATATIAGTVLVAIAAPIAVLRPWGDDPIVVVAGIALLAVAPVALLLIPRHFTSRALRWTARLGAVALLACASWLAAERLDAGVLLVVCVSGFAAALMAALAAAPIARGATSLAWSRVADVVEWVAVALSLPAALLFADVLSVLRGVMA